jgi:5-methylcytosine-specific restriction endonuclease McrA
MGLICFAAARGCVACGNTVPCHGDDQCVTSVQKASKHLVHRHHWTPHETDVIWAKTRSADHPASAECLYCGHLVGAAQHRLARWQVDHYQALAVGGPDALANVFVACIQCNSDKSDAPVEVFLASEKHRLHLSRTERLSPRFTAATRRCLHPSDTVPERLCAERYHDLTQRFCPHHRGHAHQA